MKIRRVYMASVSGATLFNATVSKKPSFEKVDPKSLDRYSLETPKTGEWQIRDHYSEQLDNSEKRVFSKTGEEVGDIHLDKTYSDAPQVDVIHLKTGDSYGNLMVLVRPPQSGLLY